MMQPLPQQKWAQAGIVLVAIELTIVGQTCGGSQPWTHGESGEPHV